METVQPRTFEKDGHTIVWGDALSALADVAPTGSVDLIFADPPYNIGKSFANDSWRDENDYVAWCVQWLDACFKLLKPTGTMYLMCSTQYMPFLDVHVRNKLKILSRITWHYDSSGVQAKRYFGSMYEPILHCVADSTKYTFNSDDILVEARTGAERKLIDYRKAIPQPYNTKKVPGNVWYFPRVRYRMPEYEEHPSQKPESLLERIVRASSNPGDVVLDPFAGTFTTAAVAKRLGRRSISVELAEEYVRVGLRRLDITTELNGRELRSPAKSFQRRDAPGQASLFSSK